MVYFTMYVSCYTEWWSVAPQRIRKLFNGSFFKLSSSGRANQIYCCRYHKEKWFASPNQQLCWCFFLYKFIWTSYHTKKKKKKKTCILIRVSYLSPSNLVKKILWKIFVWSVHGKQDFTWQKNEVLNERNLYGTF